MKSNMGMNIYSYLFPMCLLRKTILFIPSLQCYSSIHWKDFVALSHNKWYYRTTRGIVAQRVVLSHNTWYCRTTRGIVAQLVVLSHNTWYCRTTRGIVAQHGALWHDMSHCRTTRGIAQHVVLKHKP